LPGLAQDLAVEDDGLRRCGEEARNRGRAARRCIERVLGFGLVAGGNSTAVRVWVHMGVKGGALASPGILRTQRRVGVQRIGENREGIGHAQARLFSREKSFRSGAISACCLDQIFGVGMRI
jgi:hypothetical protein